MGTSDIDNQNLPKPAKATPPVNRNLPFKQRAALEYAAKLGSLVKRFPHVSYRLEDAVLATDLSEIFDKIGFRSHPQPDQQVKVLIHNIIKWLGGGHLVLLHYKPKFTEFNLVNLLRETKLAAPTTRFEGLVPVFVAATSSQKQLEMFKLLGAFGIRYAIFLTPGSSGDKNVGDLLAGLENFGALLKADKKQHEAVAAGGAEEDPAKVKKYRELMATGENLMKEGRHEEAIRHFSDAIAMGPNFNLLMDRGEAYYKSRQYVPALNDFREASRLEKSVPDPYAKIGACCLSMVKSAAAAEGADKARKWFDMGMKHMQDAYAIIQKMELGNETTPEKLPPVPYAPLLAALAETDIRGLGMADLEEKMAAFGAAVLDKVKVQEDVISDNSVDTRIERAILLARYGHYNDAEKIFRALVAEDPENAGPALNNFAVELRKNGQYAKSFEIYSELLKFQIPDRDIVVENMKTAGLRHAAQLKDKMKYDEAVAALRGVLAHRPRGREWVLCELAGTLLEMQDQAQASFTFMEALYVNPKLMQSEKFANFGDLKNLRQEMIKKLAESAPGQEIR